MSILEEAIYEKFYLTSCFDKGNLLSFSFCLFFLFWIDKYFCFCGNYSWNYVLIMGTGVSNINILNFYVAISLIVFPHYLPWVKKKQLNIYFPGIFFSFHLKYSSSYSDNYCLLYVQNFSKIVLISSNIEVEIKLASNVTSI